MQFDVNDIYIAKSQKTGKPYVDADKTVHIFLSAADAEHFKKMLPETITIDGPKFVDGAVFSASCYQAGAEKLSVNNGASIETEQLNPPKTRYYNKDTNYALGALKETKKSKFLYMLKTGKFIVPCRIENGTEIYYGAAKTRDCSYSLAFTDLDEFHMWEPSSDFIPLEVKYHELKRIAAKRDVLVNVSGNRYTITQAFFDKIDDHAKKVKKEAEERKKAKNSE
ncbi:SseB family protein [Clostridium sp. AM42-36]|jgi:hypothetical protein|nr:SseB family protein [Clostridium sp. AM42-36]